LSRSVSVHVSTYVDVDLDEIDTDDLVKELASRGRSDYAGVADHDVRLREIFEAFYTGLDIHAVNLTRKYVCDALGRTLS
jgi:hypothetical protein